MTKAADNELWSWLKSLEREGRTTPEQVVEAARDPASPGHAHFDWDDKTAGEKWRIEQARGLLSRRYRVQIETHTIEVPRYMRDPTAPTGVQSYISTLNVVKENLQHAALVQEFSRVSEHLSRARGLAEFFDLQKEMDELIEHVNLVRNKVPAPEARQ